MTPLILNETEGRKLNVLGGNVFVKVSGAETAGGYSLVLLDDEAGAGVPPHIHEREDETFHVLEGEYEFIAGDRQVTAGPGTTVHLPRGVAHGFRAIGGGRNKALVMVVPPGIENMFGELDALPPGPPDLAKVGAICGSYGIRFV